MSLISETKNVALDVDTEVNSVQPRKSRYRHNFTSTRMLWNAYFSQKKNKHLGIVGRRENFCPKEVSYEFKWIDKNIKIQINLFVYLIVAVTVSLQNLMPVRCFSPLINCPIIRGVHPILLYTLQTVYIFTGLSF